MRPTPEFSRPHALIGRVSETNYGLVFDVRSVPQPENLAYSDLGSGAAHRQSLPRTGAGVSGAARIGRLSRRRREPVRRRLRHGRAPARDRLPEAFAVLTRTPVPFLYRSKDAELYAERPLIQLSCCGEVSAVHYNSRSIAPLRLSAREAARVLLALIGASPHCCATRGFICNCRLRDGDLVVFDNQRILHGRTAFSSARHPRHLRGCYLTRDSVYSQAALLRRELAAGLRTHEHCRRNSRHLSETRLRGVLRRERFDDRACLAGRVLRAGRTPRRRPSSLAALLHDIGHLVDDVPSDIGDWTAGRAS